MKCDRCQINYPEGIVQPLNINGKYTNNCPICALDTIRKVHGIKTYEFAEGTEARRLYDQAMKFKVDELLGSSETK